MFNRKKGFTLIELLVVIAIIGILASVVLASLNSARKKSRDARRVADIKQIQLALELYFDANSTYPVGTSLAALAPDYIATIPADPLSSVGAYKYQAITSSGTQTACSSGTCTYYHLGAIMEESTNPALPGSDNTVGFDGSSTDCAGTVGADLCYDITP
ncbi:MAG: type II secretion system protein [Patescibacteria group bacterium]